MIASWNRQRRRVNRLYGRLAAQQRMEARRRRALLGWTEHVFLRFETVIWISVTGAIWIARRRDSDETNHRGPLRDLLASVWKMRRWRRLTHRVSSRLFSATSTREFTAGNRLANGSGSPWTAAGQRPGQ